MAQITITPSQIEFETLENETVLAAAIRNGYNLPHACQSGVCGSCRAQIKSGNVKAIDEYDDYVLSEAERTNGTILLCCCVAENNLEIDMPAYAGIKALNIRTLPAKVMSVEQRGEIAILKVALPKAPPFKFYAGQYMDILLKDGQRSYSIANAPSKTDYLEFHIRHRQNGLFSPMLFNGSLKTGSIIRLRGPLGGFFLNESSSKPLLFLATGTGFAPIKSILLALLENQVQRKIHFYWGVRTTQDFYDEAELQSLIQMFTDIQYTPVVSRPSEGWTGRVGHVQDVVLQDYVDLSAYEVYACGSIAMIQSAKSQLSEYTNLPHEAFFSDAFVESW